MTQRIHLLRAGAGALLLHAIVLVFLIVGIKPRTPAPVAPVTAAPKIVQAVSVDARAIEEELHQLQKIDQDKRKAEQRRQQDLARQAREAEQKRKTAERKQREAEQKQQQAGQKRRVEEQKQREAEQNRKAEEQKQREAEQKRKAEEQKQREIEQRREEGEQKLRKEAEELEQLRQQRLMEEEEKARAEKERKVLEEEKKKLEAQRLKLEEENRQRQAKLEAQQKEQQRQQDAELVVRLQSAISSHIKQHFNIAGISPGLTCKLKVNLEPGGQVRGVSVIQSSGSEIFDRRALTAVQKSSPLPLPDGVDVQTFNRLGLGELLFVFDPWL